MRLRALLDTLAIFAAALLFVGFIALGYAVTHS